MRLDRTTTPVDDKGERTFLILNGYGHVSICSRSPPTSRALQEINIQLYLGNEPGFYFKIRIRSAGQTFTVLKPLPRYLSALLTRSQDSLFWPFMDAYLGNADQHSADPGTALLL